MKDRPTEFRFVFSTGEATDGYAGRVTGEDAVYAGRAEVEVEAALNDGEEEVLRGR